MPLLLLAAWAGGMPLFLAALAMVCLNMAGIPAENSLLARYTPSKWRGTAFGMKFVLSFGVSGMGVPLMAVILKSTGELVWVFVLLAVMAALVAGLSLLLPSESPKGELAKEAA
jgi:MFS-type transporter involved in bile tolerance (Atg22 family)